MSKRNEYDDLEYEPGDRVHWEDEFGKLRHGILLQTKIQTMRDEFPTWEVWCRDSRTIVRVQEMWMEPEEATP